jgi:hypothetical protein
VCEQCWIGLFQPNDRCSVTHTHIRDTKRETIKKQHTQYITTLETEFFPCSFLFFRSRRVREKPLLVPTFVFFVFVFFLSFSSHSFFSSFSSNRPPPHLRPRPLTRCGGEGGILRMGIVFSSVRRPDHPTISSKAKWIDRFVLDNRVVAKMTWMFSTRLSTHICIGSM